MRSLKFRAWDKEGKKYLGEQSFIILPTKPSFGVTVPYKNTNNPDNIDEDCFDWADADLITGRYELEQYTGLKDKNGKEIYEGDIVRTKSCDRANFSAGAIEMVQQMFLIMNSAHYSDPEISHCEPLGYYCDTELEVIGNIHQNPELLKEEYEAQK